jgi:hypothetical protein
MRFRERNRDTEVSQRPQQSGETPTEGTPLDDETARLLAAADDAISRALSRDSQAFLEATRQEGGQ